MQSKLDKLISKLCPDGVEYKTLGDIINFKNGKGHEKAIVNDGPYIVVNSRFISTEGKVCKYSNSQIVPLYTSDILIVMSDLPNGRALAKCYLVEEDNKYTLNQRIGALSVINDNLVDCKFLYYILNRNKQLLRFDNGVDQTNLKKDDILNIVIPIPPLEIQHEIVQILDNFTELSAALLANLSEELSIRKKQYDYHLDQLLIFDDSVPIVKLGDVAGIYDGTHQTPKYTAQGVKFVSVENISDLYKTQKYISVKDYENNYKIKPQKGDVFMTRIGSIGACAIVTNDEDLAYYVTLTLIRPNYDKVNSSYLKYVIESSIGRKELRKRTLVNATPIKINLGEIGKIRIPLPTLAEQEHIVLFLDRFATLYKNISISLPAEIDARKKQYEYYRDKLLSFKELSGDTQGVE